MLDVYQDRKDLSFKEFIGTDVLPIAEDVVSWPMDTVQTAKEFLGEFGLKLMAIDDPPSNAVVSVGTFSDDPCFQHLLTAIEAYRADMWYYNATRFYFDPQPCLSIFERRAHRLKRFKLKIPVDSAMAAPEVSGGNIMDTGTTYHLRDLDSVDPDCLMQAKKPVTVRAASGPIVLDKDAKVCMPSIEEASFIMLFKAIDGTPKCHLRGTIGYG